MLVHLKEIVQKALNGKYAVGAFNTSNLEVTLGILRAAVQKKSPIIIQVSPATIQYAGVNSIAALIKTLIKQEAKDIPVALHLDHGKDLKTVLACIKAGFSSIHIDGSDLPLNENIKLTKRGVDLAHRFDVWAQGELGSLMGQEGTIKIKNKKNQSQDLTDSKQVAEFVRKTKVDTLAVSIGTKHGIFPGQERIDFKRLTEIKKTTKVPLVLHGASGVSAKGIKKAIKNGIQIINIDTVTRVAFTRALRQTLRQQSNFYDPRKILTPSIKAVQKEVAKNITIFGSRQKV